MLAIPHMMTGAAIGKAVRRPWIALPVAFASHFVLDIIPHLDSHGLFGGPGATTAPEAIAAGVDLLAGTALVVWATGRQPGRRLILAAAFAGILMDLVLNCPLWSERLADRPGTMWLCWFHRAVQHNVPPAQWVLGFGTQLIVVAAGFAYLFGIAGRAKTR